MDESWWLFTQCACIGRRSSLKSSSMTETKSMLSNCLVGLWSGRVTMETRDSATLLSASHRNLQRWRNFQCRARIVTNSSGAVNPPSSLLVELPISIGPSTGPAPVNNGLNLSHVIFQPNVPPVSRRLPSEAITSRRLDLNALHTSTSVAI